MYTVRTVVLPTYRRIHQVNNCFINLSAAAAVSLIAAAGTLQTKRHLEYLAYRRGSILPDCSMPAQCPWNAGDVDVHQSLRYARPPYNHTSLLHLTLVSDNLLCALVAEQGLPKLASLVSQSPAQATHWRSCTTAKFFQLPASQQPIALMLCPN
jgi:hypothetical protein